MRQRLYYLSLNALIVLCILIAIFFGVPFVINHWDSPVTLRLLFEEFAPAVLLPLSTAGCFWVLRSEALK